jgi:hypothetical protein
MALYKQPAVARITSFIQRQDKEDYNNIWYPCNQFPPAKVSKIELPTGENKTEPVQDPAPRVKGIRGKPPQVWHTQKKREKSLIPNLQLKVSIAEPNHN